MTPNIVLDALILLHSTISTSPCHFQEVYDKPLGMRLFMFAMKGSVSLDGVPLSIVLFFQFDPISNSKFTGRFAKGKPLSLTSQRTACGCCVGIRNTGNPASDSQTGGQPGPGHLPFGGNRVSVCWQPRFSTSDSTRNSATLYIWDLCAWGPEATLQGNNGKSLWLVCSKHTDQLWNINVHLGFDDVQLLQLISTHCHRRHHHHHHHHHHHAMLGAAGMV